MNKICLIGRICRDIELKTLGAGTVVTNFSIAQNRKVKDKDEPQFFNCVAFGPTAELISKYFKKGSQIGIEGNLRYETYEDKDKKKQVNYKVVVEQITFLDKKSDEPQQQEPAKQEAKQQTPDDDVPF